LFPDETNQAREYWAETWGFTEVKDGDGYYERAFGEVEEQKHAE
jgi:hypothetical protein